MKTSSWQPKQLPPEDNINDSGAAPAYLLTEPWEVAINADRPTMIPAAASLVVTLAWMQFKHTVKLRDSTGRLVLHVEAGETKVIDERIKGIFQTMAGACHNVIEPYASAVKVLADQVVDLQAQLEALEPVAAGETAQDSDSVTSAKTDEQDAAGSAEEPPRNGEGPGREDETVS